jgi:nicotinate-nucleotide pyrophosphorylase (carboxylating)
MNMHVRAQPPPRIVMEKLVATALHEDLGRGDVTTEACVPPGARGRAEIRARRPLVFCGIELVREVYRQVDPEVEVHDRARDGDEVGSGEAVAMIAGRAWSLLAGERVALNFAQRMSGVATLTKRYVAELPPESKARIVDTRKTTPGLRSIERYAVRCGGAINHREDLSSAVLIKDNHIAAAGGIAAAIARARAHAPHTSRIECEVQTFEELDQALEADADVILLDNFDDAQVKRAVAHIDGRAMVEVSGGVTLERIRSIAAMGVDVISVGALTHSAIAADLGMDWLLE